MRFKNGDRVIYTPRWQQANERPDEYEAIVLGPAWAGKKQGDGWKIHVLKYTDETEGKRRARGWCIRVGYRIRRVFPDLLRLVDKK